MKFFLVLRRFQQDVATLPHGHGGGFMGEGQPIQCNILLKTNFFDSLMCVILTHITGRPGYQLFAKGKNLLITFIFFRFDYSRNKKYVPHLNPKKYRKK